jgi:2-C-methyl-D-erythritol 2,4-cyclodiphosphate synthase
MMLECGAQIVNLDCTLIMQKPKIAPYIEKMAQNIAFCLGCDRSCVNVKATTEEHLGFTGREEGVSAHAVVMISLE